MQIKRLQCKVKKLEAKRGSEDPRTDRLRRSNAQLRRKLACLKKTDQKPRLNQSADLSSLKDKVSYLENENATLSENIEQLSNETINAKVDGKTYSDALRRAIYLCMSNLAIWALSQMVLTEGPRCPLSGVVIRLRRHEDISQKAFPKLNRIIPSVIARPAHSLGAVMFRRC